MKHFSKNFLHNRIPLLYTATSVLLVSVAVLSLLSGSTTLPLFELITSLIRGELASSSARIFLYIRLPRTLAALVAGGALACAGALAQGTLHNRLATPSILGVNSGAGLAITIASAFGVIGGMLTSVLAFSGALSATLLIVFFSKKFGLSRANVILCGVALNSLFGALTSAIITFFPDVGVMSNDFRVGDFSSVNFRSLAPASVIILVTLAFSFTLSNDLDALSLGDEGAFALGLSPSRLRLLFMLLVSLLSAAAVSLCGLLSFVGLIVPHALRMLGVEKSAHLLPLSALLGAAFVTLCDTLSRVLFAPYEIPVGILMAILGAPFFLFLLFSKKGEKHGRM
ncbi:MAG: iron ABC transporter permease [Clostridia bacterium]|nr:iron ABC transporter permease [Clostridia bacterium]